MSRRLRTPSWHRSVATALLCAVATAAPTRGAAAVQGDAIVNVAAVRAAELGADVGSAPTVVTVRIPTRAAVELLLYAPASSGATREAVVAGAFRGGADAGAAFSPLPAPLLTGASAPLALPSNLPLVPSRQFHQGDPIFVRVTDRDQNLDRNARETIQVALEDDLTGDVEVVLLTEDGPDTGVFVGYIQTASDGNRARYDGILQVLERSTVTARYVDPFDPTDLASAAGALDVASRVFDSRTGLPVSGARVTIVDAASGQPAAVLSDDGVSSFPSTVVSGQPVTDGAGRVHAFGAGEFRFPFLRPGSYRYVVQPPARYAAPSRASDTALQALPGAPFTLTSAGARGEAFTLDAGPITRVDIPVDPAVVALWVQKVANSKSVAIGDFLSYDLTVTNLDPSVIAGGVQVVDTLPLGFRYAPGSARRDGAAVADPAVSRDGRTLTFPVGELAPSASATFRLVVQVGAAAKPGTDAVNRVGATSAGGGGSNLAEAVVKVADELLSSRSFILGRVTAGECPELDGTGTRGVEHVRVLLEDGTFAVSDRQGLFHFEGVRRGLHVVQLDPDSLPEGWEAVSCTPNDRFAGRASSQFVDVQGDTLWRADFHLRQRPRAQVSKTEVTLALSHRLGAPLAADFHAEVRVPPGAPLGGARLTVALPRGFAHEEGSVAVDGAKAEARAERGSLVVALGDLPAGATRTVTFRVVAAADAPRGDLVVAALVSGTGAGGAAVQSPTADNVLRISAEEVLAPMRIVRRPLFPSFGVELADVDREDLQSVARLLASREPRRLVIVGHTDSVRIAPRSRAIFADNVALSLGRARSVSRVLLEALRLREDQVEIVGKGESEPVADNGDEAGRARNRRVEVQVFATERKEKEILVSVRDRSISPETTSPSSTGGPCIDPAAGPDMTPRTCSRTGRS